MAMSRLFGSNSTDPGRFREHIVAKCPAYFGHKPSSLTKSFSLIDELGGSANSPLAITTPLTLRPGSWLWIVSPFPITITSYGSFAAPEIACTEAVYVFARSRTVLMPTRPLDSKFASGWAKLPDKLKTLVLESNLKCIEAIGGFNQEPQLSLLHHLRMSPEIAGLAKDIYYTSNSFQVTISQSIFSPMRYPGLMANHLVRRLKIDLSLGGSTQWPKLQQIANGSLGFANLEYVEVRIGDWGFRMKDLTHETSDSIRECINQECKQYIQFSCYGELVFSPIMGSHGATVPAAIQQRIENMFIFRVQFKENPDDEL